MKNLFQLLIFCCLGLNAWGSNTDGFTDFEEVPGFSSCTVLIYFDSTNTGEYIITAEPIGDGPFTYLWSTNETTQTIIASTPGINYCVTITSASGCTADGCLFGGDCFLDVYSDAINGLVTSSGGVFPISFLWSTGEDTHNILPTVPGNYCVTLTDAVGCTKTKCADWSPCSATVYMDSTDNQTFTATANSIGTAPFTYLWNTGETTQTIVVNDLPYGNFCVIVTDADGCIAQACGQNYDCWAYINANYSSQELTVYANGVEPLSYLWSNGSTSQTITPSVAGEYCVTVSDFLGCQSTSCFSVGTNCGVQAWAQDSLPTNEFIIYAWAQGFGPFTYLWDYQGETSDSIVVTENAEYCVTITDAFGCQASDCTFAIPCYTSIFVENIQSNEWKLTAYHDGTAPFTYQWEHMNATTQEITVLENGYYCVTVTDAIGCSSSACLYLNACTAYISLNPFSNPSVLEVETNLDSPSYSWNTGETTASITPSSSGTYCVTVSANGCSANNCFYFIEPDIFEIYGYVRLEDSTLANPYEGIAELFSYDAANDTWNLAATVPLNNDSLTWAAEYDFGTWPAGQYITKATLDPASPYAADYFPTYQHDHLLWNEADIITLPLGWWQTENIIIMQDGINLAAGSGNISGTVTEGDGFTANDEGDRGGDPRPNTSVLLFDANEQPVRHATTDELGQYSFSNLPLGTYKLMVEIVGREQAERWVALTTANPSSTANDFKVTESGIVLGIADLFTSGKLEISPNPTDADLNIWLESSVNTEAQISVARLDGTMVLSQRSQLTNGGQYVNLDVASLPTGLYLLQVTTGKGVVAGKFIKQ